MFVEFQNWENKSILKINKNIITNSQLIKISKRILSIWAFLLRPLRYQNTEDWKWNIKSIYEMKRDPLGEYFFLYLGACITTEVVQKSWIIFPLFCRKGPSTPLLEVKYSHPKSQSFHDTLRERKRIQGTIIVRNMTEYLNGTICKLCYINYETKSELHYVTAYTS